MTSSPAHSHPHVHSRRSYRSRAGRRSLRVILMIVLAAAGLLVIALTAPLVLAHLPASPLPGTGTGSASEGVLPDGVTVHDEDLPGVGNLDAELREALLRATDEAEQDGITLELNSGWRSAAYQERLFDKAVEEHGSEEASRWAAPPQASLHVSGEAVDIGGYDAAAWLAEHGAAHGLCLVYDNEPWHFELRPDAPAEGCPATYADPTEDPRLQD